MKLTLLALAVFTAVTASIASPALAAPPKSPVFAKTESNVWVFAPGSPAPTPWRIGTGRTNDAFADAGQVSIRNANGVVTPLPGVTSADYSVLVNRANTSYTAFDPRMPRMMFVGLDGALFTPANANSPKVSFSPRGGAYAGPLRVTMTGVPTPQLAGPVRVFYRLDGGAEVASPDDTASVNLIAGAHTLIARSEQAGITSADRTETFTITLGAIAQDSDGDGIPDVVESAIGLDPFSADLAKDSDHDGWSDFDEWLREGDTTDSDGDGWTDRDEGWRGTDAGDPDSLPAADRLYQAEVIARISGWQDADATLPAGGVGSLQALDLTWRALECRAADGFEQPCSSPDEAADLSQIDSPYSVRTAADVTRVFRWQRFSFSGGEGDPVPTALTYKSWDSSVPDRSVAWVRDTLAATGSAWDTAEEWRAEAVSLLQASLVQTRDVDLTPVSGVAPGALEALAHWQAALSSGAVAFGHELGVEPTDTVRSLEGFYAGFYPDADSGLPGTGGLDHLLTDLEALTALGGEAHALRTHAEAFYAGYVPAAGRPATTDLELADTLQNNPGGLEAARFATRVLLLNGAPALDALLAAERAARFDPAGDLDGDGLSNGAEVAAVRLDGSNAADPALLPAAGSTDTDADGIADALDACPDDAAQACLTAPSLAADTDGDGTPDPLDNCLNTANADQLDADVDGVGDACPGLAVIVSPTAHLTVPTGRLVDFRSKVTAAGAGLALNYAWTFEGAAADRAVAQPGPVYFAEAGTYHVRLNVTDGVSSSEDTRTITAVGPSMGLPGGVIGVDPATEGVATALSLLSPEDHGFGPLSVQWNFGDGSAPASGDAVSHVFPANGTYTVTAALTDTRGASRSISRSVDVSDAAPVPSFNFVATGRDREFAFTDTTHSTDALVSFEWSFGDALPGTVGPAVTHTWLVPGDYEVTLAVMDADGSEASVTETVHVTGSGIQLFTVNAGSAWVRASYPVGMSDPVVVAGPVGVAAGVAAVDPGAIQIRNIDGTGFDVRYAEWSNLDGEHGPETLPILAVERGHHRMEDGTEVEADAFVASGTSVARAVTYTRAFVATPHVFATLQSAEDAAPAVVRLSGPTRKAFSAVLNEQESTMGSDHLVEEVGYVALYRAGNAGSLVVNGAPAAFTSPLLSVGQVPLAIDGCRLFLAEDTTLDAETAHKKERLSVLSLLGQCFAQSSTKAEMDPFVIRRSGP